MNKSNKLLSNLVAFRTYAKYLQHVSRRESLEETINRNMNMHLEKFPKLSRDIIKAYKQVHDLKVMPSMRSLQFGGDAISKNNARIYNCAFVHIKYPRVFAEALYLLLCGTGVGYSVQAHHIEQLPTIRKPKRENTHIIHDSIEGWADAIDALMNGYFYGAIRPIFDYSQISAKGAYLATTGSKAPGPEPLRIALNLIEKKLQSAVGRKLKSLETHDVLCILADCVLAGGIRRAALISLFDKWDQDMLSCKQGEWWVKTPYRARANNSAMLLRSSTTQEEFQAVYDACIKSNSGEPGFLWVDDLETGANPCFTGDTLVAVADGRNAVSIKQLAEENYKGPVYTTLTQTGQTVVGYCSKVWKTRVNSELVKVTLDDGSTFRCTPDHKIMLRNGQYVKAKDLIAETSLMPFNSFKRPERSYRLIHSNNGNDIAQYALVAQFYDKIKVGYEPMDIHHIDGNGANDLPNNLEVISRREHIRSHQLGKNNAVFKIKDKAKWSRNLSKASTGTSNPNSNGIESSEIFNKLKIETLKVNRKLTSQEVLNIAKLKHLSKGRLDEMGASSVSDLANKVLQLANHRVISVEFLLEKEDVYDLTVEGTHNFAIITSKTDDNFIGSSGVFVHNCVEIGLHSNQFCNLTTTNMTGIKSEKDFLNRIYAATLLGTLQASYTDFPYLGEKWKQVTESEALIGCSFTGIADAPAVTPELLQKAAALVLEVNEKYAKLIGINVAARTTAIKPEGTASCVLGSASGIHARHAPYYLRRIRLNKEESLAKYLKLAIPELVEDDLFSNRDLVVTIPQESPEGSIVRDQESALTLLDRVLLYNQNWVIPGHRSGKARHNVSCTINYKPEEVEELAKRMWEERNVYSGISLLPYDGGSYQQAPFESCDEETFQRLNKLVKDIDLTKVLEMDDQTNMSEQLACAGGVCEIR